MVNNEELLNSFKGKKVFLTGHTGFKGSWLLAMLHSAGAHVTGFSLAPEEKSHFNILEANSFCNSIIEDIRNKEKIEEKILQCQPDFLFHLAAQPLVRYSYQNPLETFEVNTIGTANVLNALRKLSKKCTSVFITTDKVYHNKEWQYPYRETDRLGGYDPYSASKATCEIVIDSFRNSFFSKETYDKHLQTIAIARAGNVIGGGDYSKDRIIPDIVNALTNNEPINVRNPMAVRPWQHVLEPLFGYLLLAKCATENMQNATAYNFGPFPQDTFTVKQLVENVLKIWGSGSMQKSIEKNQPHEANLLKLDINKAIAELNWIPKLTASKSIDWTICWYQKPQALQKEFTFAQIEKYKNLK